MRRALLLPTLACLASASFAEDWPQYRGPHGDGISTETGWTNEGRDGWKGQVGLGYSSVVVRGDRLYTVGWVPAEGADEKSDDGEDVVVCLDAATGERVWEHRYPAKRWAKFHGGGTNSTPSIDGDRLYVLNRESRFTCLDARTGKPHWSRVLLESDELEEPTWGFAASPLVLDEAVVVNVGKVLACDKQTGAAKWTTERDYGHAYSTPTAAKLAGKDVLAGVCGSGVFVLDRATGKELATSEWTTKYDVNAATPVVVGDDRLFVSSGYGHGATLLRFTGDALESLWETKAMRNQMATSVLLGDHLYGLDEGVLKCFDLSGQEKWSERQIGKGAIGAAGDKLLLVTEDGELVVAAADPGGYRELSRAKVVDGGVCWTMPVLANGRIYARNSLGELACRDHRGTEQ